MGKVSKTFSVEDKIYARFESICKMKSINKSDILQKAIKEFIGQNYDINKDKIYKLKYGDSDDIVKIESTENEFILLSNGNRFNIFDFEILYEEFDNDVQKVLNELNYENRNDETQQIINNDEEIIDSSILDKTVLGLDPNVVKSIFQNIDTKNLQDRENIVRDILNKNDQESEEFIRERTSLEDKCAKEREFIKEFNKQQFINKLGTEKIETDVEKFLNQTSIEPLKFISEIRKKDDEPVDESAILKDDRSFKEKKDDLLEKYKTTIDSVKDTIEFVVTENEWEGPKQTIEENREIVKRIKEKSHDLQNNVDNIEEFANILTYIFDTTVKIEILSKSNYIINIPQKYHSNIELEVILKKLGGNCNFHNFNEPITEVQN